MTTTASSTKPAKIVLGSESKTSTTSSKKNVPPIAAALLKGVKEDYRKDYSKENKNPIIELLTSKKAATALGYIFKENDKADSISELLTSKKFIKAVKYAAKLLTKLEKLFGEDTIYISICKVVTMPTGMTYDDMKAALKNGTILSFFSIDPATTSIPQIDLPDGSSLKSSDVIYKVTKVLEALLDEDDD